MKVVLSAAAAAIVLAHSAQASPLEKRAVTCDTILPQMQANMAAANRFCNVYLQLIPVTSTQTFTATLETDTVTTAAYTTTTQIVTPAVVTKVLQTTQKSTLTVTPSTKTIVQTVTSTAYMDPYGSTIAVLKRDVEPTKANLAARALVTPAYLKSLRKTDIRAACMCLNLPNPTYISRVTVAATATATKSIMRTMKTTTTLAKVTTQTTNTNVKAITVTAKAPLTTTTAYAIRPISGCPPGFTSDWQCPEMTGDDDGRDPNYENCPVLAQDGYSGYCLYWADDGSPAASTLLLGDGSGDSNNDEYRDATYGDDDTDDCPSWADFTCAANSTGNSKRSTLERLSDMHHSKRGYTPKRVTLAEHKKAGLRKMPLGLKRGGKFVQSA